MFYTSRTFYAPVERVWEVMVEPEQMVKMKRTVVIGTKNKGKLKDLKRLIKGAGV